MHFFNDYVKSRIPSLWKPNSSGWVSGNCPMCVINGESRPDTKKRGGFLFEGEGWRYHCFNCHYTAGWEPGQNMSPRVKKLLKQFGCDEADLQRASIELMREEETTRLLNPLPKEKPSYVPNWPEVELPNHAKFLLDIDTNNMHVNCERAVKMLSERDLLHWHDWAFTAGDVRYRKRIILPYRYKNKIVGYNARFTGKGVPDNVSKYLVTKPPNFVFNLDRQKPDRNVVVVVEGDFDAISIDGVALGSNSLSDEQASLINQLNKRTILLPDGDKAGNGLIEPAIKQGWAVSFPEWLSFHKDANSASQEYGRAFVLKSIIESATDNPTKIRVLAKQYLK